jgi:hypothetical protein
MITIKSMAINPAPKPYVYENYDEQCMKCETFDIKFEMFDDVRMERAYLVFRLDEDTTLAIQNRLNKIKEKK